MFNFGSGFDQTGASLTIKTKLGFSWLWNSSSRLLGFLVDFGSSFDQANTSLAFSQELGFVRIFLKKRINSISAFQFALRYGLRLLIENWQCLDLISKGKGIWTFVEINCAMFWIIRNVGCLLIIYFSKSE